MPHAHSRTATSAAALVLTTAGLAGLVGGAGSAAADVPTRYAQQITFTMPAQVHRSSVVLAATGGRSGNPVTFAVVKSASDPGVCWMASATTLRFRDGGTCVVRASQAGNKRYAAAPAVTRQTMFVYDANPHPRS